MVGKQLISKKKNQIGKRKEKGQPKRSMTIMVPTPGICKLVTICNTPVNKELIMSCAGSICPNSSLCMCPVTPVACTNDILI